MPLKPGWLRHIGAACTAVLLHAAAASAGASDVPPAPALHGLHDYLLQQVQPDGRFVYLRNAQGEIQPGYNMVRHGGTMFALAQWHTERASPGNASALLRTAAYLRQCCLAPAGPGTLAVWSQADERPDGQRVAALGAAALGLVGLVAAHRIDPAAAPLDDLRRLGHFIVSLQADDGSLRSRVFADGRADNWTSLYYPGEAALALTWLAEVDAAQAQHWRTAARAALAHLADQRRGQSVVPPDHWALIATGALWCADARWSESMRDTLLTHAWQVAAGMLGDQAAALRDGATPGSFTPDDRATPAATRLEGLLALTVLPWPAARAEAPFDPQATLAQAIEAGTAALRLAIVTDGPWRGAVTRHLATPRGRASPRHGEIRIDYVQHALSALLAEQAHRQGRSVCPLLLPPRG